MDAPELLDLYQATGHRNPRTRGLRVITARQFVEWCQANDLPFPFVAEVDAHRYLEFRRSLGNSESTIATKLHGLRHFYRWMADRGFVDDNSPFKGIVATNQVPKPRDTVTASELRRLWEAAPSPTHRTVLGLLAFGGLGIEEIAALDVSDFRRDDSGYYSVKVRSRAPTRGHVQVLLPPEVAESVLLTLGHRRSGPLVPRPDATGQRLNRGIVRRMVATCGKHAELPIRVTPGMLTFSVRALSIEHGFSYIGVVRAIGEMHPSKARRWIDGGPARPEQHAAIRLGRLVFDTPGSALALLSEASVLLNESTLPASVAVMAAGAALEKHLRELSVSRGVFTQQEVQKERTLNSYASELIKMNVIHRSTHKHIEEVAGWRNDAAHGWFERVDPLIAESTIRRVRQIIERYPLTVSGTENPQLDP